MRLLSFILIVTFFTGCYKESSTQTGQKSAALGESFTLKAGENIIIRNGLFSFRFDSVLSDSRCPEGFLCDWAGNAAVLITLPGVSDTLNTFLDPKQITYDNYRIELQLLTPYPNAGLAVIPQNLYNAQFIVNRK